MSRIVTALAFAILLVTLLASVVSLSNARFAEPHDGTPYMLSMPDLSNPRATIDTLISNGDIAAGEFLRDGVPWKPSPAMLRMMDTIDGSAIAPAGRELEVAQAAAQLKDVLDRLPSSLLSEVPDVAAVKQRNLTEWRIPGTPIVIAKVISGPQTGQFLFSPQTIALASELYETLQTVPYRTGQRGSIYEEWRSTPGPLLPRALVKALPTWFRIQVFGQAVWQWLGLVLLLAATAIAVVQSIRWGIRHDIKATSRVRRYGQPLAALAVIVLSFCALALIELGLKLWGDVLEALLFLLQLVAIGGATWFVIALIERIGELIVAVRGLQEASFDSQLIRVISTLLRITVAAIAGILAAQFVGVPVGPLLAGLGIGGLAIALAVRPTLENVIGGLTLFADRPARVGEYCRFGAESGTVEEIGLRTTKIRKSDDTVVTISNAELAQIRIENFSRRRKFLFSQQLSLRYDISMGQLQEITTSVRELLRQHTKVLEESEHVQLTGFGEYALNLEISASVDVTSSTEFRAVQEELNLSILDILRSAGTSVAFPSRTNYMAKDVMSPEPDVASAVSLA